MFRVMSNLTLDDFITKYNGKYVDWDHFYGPQCVDLIRYYQQEVLGFPPESIPAAPTAKKVFLNFPDGGNQYFTKIKSVYKDPQIPIKGDIVFWGWYPGITTGDGHVAICTGAGTYQLIVFNQNYGKPNFCRFTNFSYRGIIGWLRPK